jgi:methylase of polypeptide subunit release factors
MAFRILVIDDETAIREAIRMTLEYEGYRIDEARSGQDGLDAIRVVAEVAARLLVDGGLLLCEHADVQHESAPAVFSGLPSWHTVRDHLDLAGRPRFVTARRVARRQPEAGTIAL